MTPETAPIQLIYGSIIAMDAWPLVVAASSSNLGIHCTQQWTMVH